MHSSCNALVSRVWLFVLLVTADIVDAFSVTASTTFLICAMVHFWCVSPSWSSSVLVPYLLFFSMCFSSYVFAGTCLLLLLCPRVTWDPNMLVFSIFLLSCNGAICFVCPDCNEYTLFLLRLRARPLFLWSAFRSSLVQWCNLRVCCDHHSLLFLFRSVHSSLR